MIKIILRAMYVCFSFQVDNICERLLIIYADDVKIEFCNNCKRRIYCVNTCDPHAIDAREICCS